jgi:hypothetical protein
MTSPQAAQGSPHPPPESTCERQRQPPKSSKNPTAARQAVNSRGQRQHPTPVASPSSPAAGRSGGSTPPRYGGETRDTGHETRDTRHETRDTRHETRDTRYETRDTGHETRDTRHETRDTVPRSELGLSHRGLRQPRPERPPPLPGRSRPHFRDQNRRGIGKSQSIWTDSKMVLKFVIRTGVA